MGLHPGFFVRKTSSWWVVLLNRLFSHQEETTCQRRPFLKTRRIHFGSRPGSVASRDAPTHWSKILRNTLDKVGCFVVFEGTLFVVLRETTEPESFLGDPKLNTPMSFTSAIDSSAVFQPVPKFKPVSKDCQSMPVQRTHVCSRLRLDKHLLRVGIVNPSKCMVLGSMSSRAGRRQQPTAERAIHFL